MLRLIQDRSVLFEPLDEIQDSDSPAVPIEPVRRSVRQALHMLRRPTSFQQLCAEAKVVEMSDPIVELARESDEESDPISK